MSNAEEPIPETTGHPPAVQPPAGARRWNARGELIIDAMAGRTSVFGFGFAPLQDAVRLALESSTGDSAAMIDSDSADGNHGDNEFSNDLQANDLNLGLPPQALMQQIREIFADDPSVATESILLRPSADAAVDSAIALARRYQPEKSFRTIALVGSDHGRTGMCRSASGRPELHDSFGPMMAGFSHVPWGDIDALRSAVDEQTASVLLSPVDLAHGAVACDSDYLTSIREICDEHNLLLVMDETQLVLGASGKMLTFASLANIHTDIAVISAGLFGGLPGGLVMSSARVTHSPVQDVDRFPVQAAVAAQTLAAMQQQGLPLPLDDVHPLTVAIAKSLSGFEFVRDIHAVGMTIGIETDLDSSEMVRAARRSGLRLAQAGPTSVCLQLPLLMTVDEEERLLSRLSSAMESLERSSAEMALS